MRVSSVSSWGQEYIMDHEDTDKYQIAVLKHTIIVGKEVCYYYDLIHWIKISTFLNLKHHIGVM